MSYRRVLLGKRLFSAAKDHAPIQAILRLRRLGNIQFELFTCQAILLYSQKMNDILDKQQLRRSIRKRRASLTVSELHKAQENLAKQGRKSNSLLRSTRIVSYAPFAGEISPSSLVNQLSATTVYFPKIINFRLSQMRFYSANKVDTLNRYGIKEPMAIGLPWPANAFDVILVPLVAFDRSGTRVGMGAGYYDRALQSLTHQQSTKPYLLGVAHHFQEVKSLERAPWDVPLDAILTDHEFIQI